VVNAVQDVSFDVPDGELFTLLGPSGCGKTTTLRSIAGLERPRSGSIALDGRVVYSSDQGIFVAPNRRNFGMVFQSYAIWPHMNVFKNVAFPLEVRKARPSRKEIEQKVMRVLATVQLAELVDQPLRGAEQLTIHVELPLEPRAVADPDRAAAPPARQMRQLPLGQVPLAADAEHDLQVRAALQPGGGRIGEEGEELVRLIRASRHPQSLHGQAGVTHPGVAVVPVPLAADGLRQRGGWRRHDRARRRERHGLQHAPGMAHQLLPRPLIVLVNR